MEQNRSAVNTRKSMEKSRKATENSWRKMEKHLNLGAKKLIVRKYKAARSLGSYGELERKGTFNKYSKKSLNKIKSVKNKHSHVLKKTDNKEKETLSNISQKTLKNYENQISLLENYAKELGNEYDHARLNNPYKLPNMSKENYNSLSYSDKKDVMHKFELEEKRKAVEAAKREKRNASEKRYRNAMEQRYRKS